MFDAGSVTKLKAAANGVVNPEFPDWPNLVDAPTDEPIALFYPKRGQGSYANYSVGIQTQNAETPTGLVATSSNTGGSLPAATYNYQIAALSENGETLVSAPVEVVIAGGAVTNSITLAWTPVALATGYVIYGRTAGVVGVMVTIGQGTYTFTDTGAITPVVTPNRPIVNPADLPPRNPQFTVSVYDNNLSTTQPVEQFLCTLTPAVDSSGQATELEEIINPFSNYISVVNNTLALLDVPEVTSVVPTLMGGGDSGTAPTSFDVAAAYGIFADKQLYQINTLINGGHADPIVQLAMDTLAQGRGDTVAMLDVPSNSQQFQQAINYRTLSLNLNSEYSALFCPDVLEADLINGKQQYVPFSGWAAALCARTDRVANPSFSIAGLNRGIVNVLKSRYTYDDGQATEMFKKQVNYTRTFIGQGIALWEQQTLSAKQSALSWVSVRRIVNVMKTALYQFLLYSLQEPNDDFTGRQIVSSCTTYLQLIKDARGISDFTVVSDASNNSAAMFNSGIRRVTVVIVPVIPIHEIQLQMVISKQGISFQEVLSQVAGQ